MLLVLWIYFMYCHFAKFISDLLIFLVSLGVLGTHHSFWKKKYFFLSFNYVFFSSWIFQIHICPSNFFYYYINGIGGGAILNHLCFFFYM